MDLGQGLYTLATHSFRANYIAFVSIAMIQAALQVVPPLISARAVLLALPLSSLLQIPLFYLALVPLVAGRGGFPGAPGGFLSFAFRFVAIGVPPALVLFLPVDPAVATLLMIVASVTMLGLFGTALPDVVAGGAGRFGAALERGRRSFGSFLVWMLQGPVLTLFGLGLAVTVLSAIAAIIGAGVEADPEGRPLLAPWYVGLVAIVGALGGAYVTALSAAVLARCWALGGGRA